MQRTYFIIYQTTNKLNGKTYIGKHKTSNLDDGYLGSGRAILQAIDKYGKDNFYRTILFMAFNADALNWVERFEFVTETVVNDPSTYNMILGGAGGFHDPALRERCEETKRQKYGDAHFNNMDKHRQTCIDRYGVEYSQQNPEIRSRSVETKIDRYGENHMERMRDMGKATRLEKYGDVNFTNKEQAKLTSLERYGVDNYSKSEEGRGRIRQRQLGHKRTIGALNGKAKQIVLTAPDGTEHVSYGNFKETCSSLGLPMSTIKKSFTTGAPINRGPAAGWTMRYID